MEKNLILEKRNCPRKITLVIDLFLDPREKLFKTKMVTYVYVTIMLVTIMTDDITDQGFSQNAPFVTICHYFLLPSPSRVTVQKVTKPFGKP